MLLRNSSCLLVVLLFSFNHQSVQLMVEWKREEEQAAPQARRKQFKSNFTFHISLKSNLIELVELFVGRFAEWLAHSSSPLSAPNQFCSTAPQEQGRQNWITAGFVELESIPLVSLIPFHPTQRQWNSSQSKAKLLIELDCSLGGRSQTNQLFHQSLNKSKKLIGLIIEWVGLI